MVVTRGEAVLILLGIAVPVLSLVAPLGLPLANAIAALLVLAAARSLSPAFAAPRFGWLLMALFGLLGMTSALWALDAARALSAAPRLFLGGLAGLVVMGAARTLPASAIRRVALVTLACWAALVALLAVDTVLGHGLAHVIESDFATLSRAHVVAAVLTWPLAALAWQWRGLGWAAATLAAGLAVTLKGGVDAAQMAVLGALAMALATWARPRASLNLLRIGMVAVILGMPVLALAIPPVSTTQGWNFISNSAHHRLTIWRFVGQHIAEKPLLGWGFDASRALPNADDEVVAYRRRGIAAEAPPYPVAEPQLPLHPHNFALQIWLELGLAGALLACALIWRLAGAIAAAPLAPVPRALLAGAVTTGFIIACLSFGIWQAWWQAALWFTAALSAMAALPKDRPPLTTAP